MFVNAGFSAYLPVVDVSKGDVSARALFGEEIAPSRQVAVAPVQKVIARSAKKTANTNIASADVLKPNRPSSDLWAKNNDAPLRMPRMDEIAVINSDIELPEESLDVKPIRVAKNVTPRITSDEALSELQQLRNEVAKLKQAQENTRVATVRTPIANNIDKVVAKDDGRSVNVRREIVKDEFENQNIARKTSNVAEPKLASVNSMSKMSPNELKKAFKKTYLSENKHLSTYQMDNRYDEVSDMSSGIEGFTAQRDLSEMDSGVRPLEIKISFLNGDSSISRENYTLLSETASVVVNNPKRAVQVAIPESVTHTKDGRKLASRRLAIIEQVLRDTGVSDQRIVPVLSQRDDDVFVLRIISGDVFDSLTQQKRNMFGDKVSSKTYKSMSW
nr:hypothetical protein [Candidatus Enterousia merdequi]